MTGRQDPDQVRHQIYGFSIELIEAFVRRRGGGPGSVQPALQHAESLAGRGGRRRGQGGGTLEGCSPAGGAEGGDPGWRQS